MLNIMDNKFAVIQTGGKQYIVKEGRTFKIEKLKNATMDGNVSFDRVLLVADGDNVKVGKPIVEGAGVSAKVKSEGRAKKITILRYKSKTRSRKKKGHRQPFTEVTVQKIDY